MFVVKCVPIVGTAATGVEAIKALIDGDGMKFAAKSAQTCVSASLDVVFLGTYGTCPVQLIAMRNNVLARAVVTTFDVGCGFFSGRQREGYQGVNENQFQFPANGYINANNTFNNRASTAGNTRASTAGNTRASTAANTSTSTTGNTSASSGNNKSNQDKNEENNGGNGREEEDNGDESDEDESTTDEEIDENISISRVMIIDPENHPILEGYVAGVRHPLDNATLTRNLQGNMVPANDTSPTIEYSLRNNGRPEYLHAEIRREHLDTGEPTEANPALAERIREFGDSGDHAGHGLGNQFGGLMREYNLFPQNPSINTGHWRAEYELLMKRWLENGGRGANIQFQLRHIYQNDQATRSEDYYFLIILRIDDRVAEVNEVEEATGQVEPVLFGYVPNPPSIQRYTVDGPEDYQETIRKTKKKDDDNVKRRK